MTGPHRAPPAPLAPPAPPLARTTLDRAAHRRTDPAWLAEAARSGRLLVVDSGAGGRTLVTGDADRPELVLLGPGGASAPAADLLPEQPRLFLGVEPDGTAVFALDAPLPELPGARPATLREVGQSLSDRDAGLLTTAVALTNWHAGHPYSSRTGLPTTVAEAGWSRVDAGGVQTWPRTDPAMIVLVNDGLGGPAGRCLLGSNAAWPARGGVRRYSCLAGYVEPGESAEAAVVREVEEEVGIVPSRVEYAGSQAWPFPGSLMLGFFAWADPDRPLRLDPAEMADARWFTRAEVGAAAATTSAARPSAAAVPAATTSPTAGTLVRLPPPSSIAYFLIDRWLRSFDPAP